MTQTSTPSNLLNSFGSIMEGRSYEGDTNLRYRFGFNGKEKDDETYGKGNEIDFGDRLYDGRLVRWLSTDPMMAKYPNLSPYSFCRNSPINFIEVDGNVYIIQHEKNSWQYKKIRMALRTIQFTNPKSYAYLNDPARKVFIAIGSIAQGNQVGKTNLNYRLKNQLYIKDTRLDEKGQPKDATVERSPNAEEQEKQRANGGEVKPVDLSADEESDAVTVDKNEVFITIDYDKITESNKRFVLAIYLSHELGHAYFAFTKTLRAWIWYKIDTDPDKHGENNESEDEAKSQEIDTGKNWKKGKKEGRKDKTEYSTDADKDNKED